MIVSKVIGKGLGLLYMKELTKFWGQSVEDNRDLSQCRGLISLICLMESKGRQ